MNIFRKLGWFFKEEKRSYLIGVLSLMMVSVFQLVPPKVIGIVVDAIHDRSLKASTLFLWLGILFAAGVIQYLFRFVWRVHIWGSAARLEKILRERLFRHFMKMDATFYQKNRIGDLMAHATNDISAIQMVAGAGILTFADSLITGGTTIIAMMLVVNWRLTVLALLPLPLLAVMARVLGSKIHVSFRNAQAAFSDINDKAQESITGMKVIKTFGQEKEDQKEFTEKVEAAIKMDTKVNFLDALFDPLTALIIGVSYILTIIVGGRYVMEGTVTIGELITFITYIALLIWPMFAIGRLFNVLERGSASYDRVEELLQKSSSVHEAKDAVIASAQGVIEMDVEEFHYPDSEQSVLHDVAFTVDPGETIGIVGRTGAGKTTIMSLLMREYDQYQGSIQFGNHSIRDYTFDALLGAIGYVPQDHFLFSMTIRDNIRFAHPDASQEEVEKAARLTAIHEDILQLPEGYDTMVGERGVSLSGGQKQRISIARALLSNPELLILDDALSAVDAKTEEAILSALKAERAGKTTMIVAHRLSSVMHAKEIIVLDQGTITERGTHSELLALDGWYKKMYDMQQLEAKIEGGER